MIQTVKQKTVVGKNGRVEILSSTLPEGSLVEVIVRAAIPSDTTEYLLSSEANRKHLMEAIDNVERGKNLIAFTPEEWNEKYNIRII